METMPEYGLKITIEGRPGDGKTIAAKAIRTLLEGMGAWACVRDGDEIIWDHRSPHKIPPRSPDYPLGRTSIVIRTKHSE